MCFPLDPQQRKSIARRRQQTRDHRLGRRLEDYREESTARMTERFHLVPEMPAETVPVGGK